MSHIIFPTLDLFVYQLREGLGDSKAQIRENHKTFWANLPLQIQGDFVQTALEAELNESDPRYIRLLGALSAYSQKDEARYQKLLEVPDLKKNAKTNNLPFKFENAINDLTVSGYYYPVRLSDTYGLLLNCSVNDIENYHPVSWVKNLRDLGDFKVHDLPDFNLQKGNLGKTWIVSGFLPPKADPKAIAQQAYLALMDEQWQHPQEGRFLGATFFEVWKAPRHWKDENSQEKNSHVLIVLYPPLPTRQQRDEFLTKARKFYRDWMKVFCYRNKILWAYGESRRLKGELQADYEKIIALGQNIAGLNQDELQSTLQRNIDTLSKYVVNLNLLEIQEQVIITNLKNYRHHLEYMAVKSRSGKVGVSEFKYPKVFGEVVSGQYLVQIKQEYTSFTPALRVQENVISTIRGILEAEKVKGDRKRVVTIQVLGTGIGAAGIFAISYGLVKPEKPVYLPVIGSKIEWPISPAPHPLVFSIVLSIIFGVAGGWVASVLIHRKNKA